MDKDFDEFNMNLKENTQQLVDDLIRTLQCKKIEVVSVTRGSVVVQIRIPTQDLPDFEAALEEHKEAMKSNLKVREVLIGQTGLKFDSQITFSAKWNRTYKKGEVFWKGALSDGKNRGTRPYYCPEGTHF